METIRNKYNEHVGRRGGRRSRSTALSQVDRYRSMLGAILFPIYNITHVRHCKIQYLHEQLTLSKTNCRVLFSMLNSTMKILSRGMNKVFLLMGSDVNINRNLTTADTDTHEREIPFSFLLNCKTHFASSGSIRARRLTGGANGGCPVVYTRMTTTCIRTTCNHVVVVYFRDGVRHRH